MGFNGSENRLLLLNGPSSAGKSTIAGELQKKLRLYNADPVIISIDDYMKIGTDEEIWEDDVFEVMPDMCRDITPALRQGKWVIVDHVITSERIYDALLDAAAGFGMVEESDKGYNQPAYDTATRQYTVQWTWLLAEPI